MKKIFVLIFLFLPLWLSQAFATEQTDELSVLTSGKAWAHAIAARDDKAITALYDPQAILYATFSNMLTRPEDIHHYFVKLMQHPKLDVHFIRQEVRLYGNTAINSGIYIFTYEKDHAWVKIPARYTFVYTKTPKGWLIVDHHSSVFPDKK